jgi:predicted RNA binding protein YcfA (HicA-like mRNA interferase family)
VVSGRELVALLCRAGFAVVRQKGSHVSLSKGPWRTVVPLHDELARGTLLGILAQCGMTRADLDELRRR